MSTLIKKISSFNPMKLHLEGEIESVTHFIEQEEKAKLMAVERLEIAKDIMEKQSQNILSAEFSIEAIEESIRRKELYKEELERKLKKF